MVGKKEQNKNSVLDESKDSKPDHLEFARELQELARKSIDGDKASYKIFLDKLLPQVRYYVYKQWWGDDTSQEDLVQDVLIAVHTSLNSYDPNRPIIPWLRSIVSYKVADLLRKFTRWHGNEIVTENIETFADSSTNNHAKSIEELDYIEDALKQLPEKQAHVVRMAKIQGLSLKEIASQTGLSLAAVKTHVHRAYKKMLAYREENG